MLRPRGTSCRLKHRAGALPKLLFLPAGKGWAVGSRWIRGCSSPFPHHPRSWRLSQGACLGLSILGGGRIHQHLCCSHASRLPPQPGDSVMVVPTLPDEEAKKLFPKGVFTKDLPSGKKYLRYTPQPE